MTINQAIKQSLNNSDNQIENIDDLVTQVRELTKTKISSDDLISQISDYFADEKNADFVLLEDDTILSRADYESMEAREAEYEKMVKDTIRQLFPTLGINKETVYTLNKLMVKNYASLLFGAAVFAKSEDNDVEAEELVDDHLIETENIELSEMSDLREEGIKVCQQGFSHWKKNKTNKPLNEFAALAFEFNEVMRDAFMYVFNENEFSEEDFVNVFSNFFFIASNMPAIDSINDTQALEKSSALLDDFIEHFAAFDEDLDEEDDDDDDDEWDDDDDDEDDEWDDDDEEDDRKPAKKFRKLK